MNENRIDQNQPHRPVPVTLCGVPGHFTGKYAQKGAVQAVGHHSEGAEK
jgi:hypothetical protein